MKRTRRGNADTPFLAGCAVAAVALFVLFVGYPVAVYHHVRHVTCHVIGKDRTSGSGGSMRVYTSDCGNFEVRDAMWAGNFHSSDTYRKIAVGQVYEFRVQGFRIPLISEFPNITSVQAVS